MNLPQFDLARQHSSLRAEFDSAWTRVIESGRFILGPEVEAFEEELAEYLGGGSVVGVNSGSDALYLALRAAGIGPNDEVVLSTYSFSATLEAVLRVGARPIFVDCSETGFNSSPDQFIEALSSRTRAVIVVHLFGMPVDLSTLAPICRSRGIALIEDTAQALGASSGTRKIGTFGDFGCFSFYPNKNLGALGDGGAIWVADPAQAKRVRALRNHGRLSDGTISDEWGSNSRLGEIQAAMLRIKLPFLDQWIKERRRIAAQYHRGLADTNFLVQDAFSTIHSFNQFAILHPERDRLRVWLRARGVEARIYYESALHQHPALANAGRLPVAESRVRQVLALPMYPELDTAAAARVCELIHSLPDSLGPAM